MRCKLFWSITYFPILGAPIVHPLTHQVAVERSTAIMECVVASEGIQGQWFKNNEPIDAKDNRIHIAAEETMRNLVIENLSRTDSGEYSYRFGTAMTSARLDVDGK